LNDQWIIKEIRGKDKVWWFMPVLKKQRSRGSWFESSKVQKVSETSSQLARWAGWYMSVTPATQEAIGRRITV
jgi:D-serine dehydratase